MLLFISLALAAQTSFSAKHNDRTYDLAYTWKNQEGEKQTIQFSLPAAAVEADLDFKTKFPRGDLTDSQLVAIRAYADTLPKGTKLKAWKDDGVLRLSATASSGQEAREAVAGGEAAAEAALQAWLPQHGYTQDKHGSILPDHIALAREYRDEVAPLVAALSPAQGERGFTDDLLSFLQSIPYEKRPGGKDPGYRRPLSVLVRNKGDCDSKSTLFLAAFTAAFPEVAAGIVYIKDHAFAAVALESEGGDFGFRNGGTQFLIAEPVGPALAGVGEGGGKSKRRVRWGRYELRQVE